VNVAASVRQRLLALSRSRGEDYNLILTRYAVERFLYRLAQTDHANQFVLKGAMLLQLWTDRPYRPTRDLDLLGLGSDSPERMKQVFQEVCRASVEPDGLAFDPATVKVADIREQQEYQGRRVQVRAQMGKARIALQVDIGFGDAVTPAPELVAYPTLLDLPAPRLRAYPRETVIAEKLQALVALGLLNSRMKDFFDLLLLGREFQFAGRTLSRAIRATFERRRTEMPRAAPPALTAEFSRAPDKVKQWQAFLRRHGLEVGTPDLPTAISRLHEFLLPPLLAAARKEDFDRTWPAGGPWSGTV
jgi:predicted nucleotidyltransferase component of viral defense system